MCPRHVGCWLNPSLSFFFFFGRLAVLSSRSPRHVEVKNTMCAGHHPCLRAKFGTEVTRPSSTRGCGEPCLSAQVNEKGRGTSAMRSDRGSTLGYLAPSRDVLTSPPPFFETSGLSKLEQTSSPPWGAMRGDRRTVCRFDQKKKRRRRGSRVQALFRGVILS